MPDVETVEINFGLKTARVTTVGHGELDRASCERALGDAGYGVTSFAAAAGDSAGDAPPGAAH